MTLPPESAPGDDSADSARPNGSTPQIDRARWDELLGGGLLPSITDDERGEPGEGFSKSWYENNRPPHHDR